MEKFYIEKLKDVISVFKSDNKELHSFNDEPAIYTEYGYKEWRKDGKLHRDNDKPAIETKEGLKMYYQNGSKHRINGKPAVIHPDGSYEYWINGKQMNKEQYFKFIIKEKVKLF